MSERPGDGHPGESNRGVEALKAEIRRHDYLYYVEARPEIADGEYDRLYGRLSEIEAAGLPASASWQPPGRPAARVSSVSSVFSECQAGSASTWSRPKGVREPLIYLLHPSGRNGTVRVGCVPWSVDESPVPWRGVWPRYESSTESNRVHSYVSLRSERT